MYYTIHRSFQNTEGRKCHVIYNLGSKIGQNTCFYFMKPKRERSIHLKLFSKAIFSFLSCNPNKITVVVFIVMTYGIADMKAFYARFSIDKKLALFCYPSGTSNKIYIPSERDLYHFYLSFNFTFPCFKC